MPMRKILFAAASILMAQAIRAQSVAFNLSLSHQVYITGEKVEITFKIKNTGIAPIIVADYEAYKDNRVEIEIKDHGHKVVKPFKEGAIIESLALEHDEEQSFRVPLTDWFPLGVGHYQVKIRVFSNGYRYDSPIEVFDIVDGMELATASHYVSRNPPVERTLHLVYWSREGRELAFLRAEDRPGFSRMETLMLGDIMRVKRPSIERDSKNPELFYIYRQVNRDTLSRIGVVSNAEGIRVADIKHAVESASSPMIDSLREAVERKSKK